MALLAETLVEEWLNRQGFFTIRGIKLGVHEMDLLAIDHQNERRAWHVEVQASFRPVSYLAGLPTKLAKERGISKTSTKRRSTEDIRASIADWIQRKFFLDAKQTLRTRLSPGTDWSFKFVHGVINEQRELDEIQAAGIELIPLQVILEDLCRPRRSKAEFTAAAGGDLAEVIRFYSDIKTSVPAPHVP
ncbi:MAG: hypothetical protein QOH01_3153 [Verrucomicrobiota bacterium]